MQKFWAWLLSSSADPSQPALTAKGLITGLVPMLMFVFPLFHLHVSVDQLNTLPGLFYNLVFALLAVVSVVMTAIGAARKIWLTLVSPQA